jgi:hypothetical protein
MPVIPSQSYTQIRSSLKTGDLFFFFGTSPAAVLIEDLESFAELPPYSHVGMVINDDGNLYFWDAPGSGDCFKDPYASDPNNRIYGNPVHTGCRVAPLDSLLAYYATVVEQPFQLRQLSAPVSADGFNALRTFIDRIDGLPFPNGPGPKWFEEFSGLMANYLAGQEGMSVLYGTYFCAQLVADSYMHMGLLNMDEWPPNSYSPADFVRTDKEMPFVSGLSLDTPTPIDFDWTGPIDPPQQCAQAASAAETATMP